MADKTHQTLIEVVNNVMEELKKVDSDIFEGKLCQHSAYFTVKELDKKGLEARAIRYIFPICKRFPLGALHWVAEHNDYTLDPVLGLAFNYPSPVWKRDEYPLIKELTETERGSLDKLDGTNLLISFFKGKY